MTMHRAIAGFTIPSASVEEADRRARRLRYVFGAAAGATIVCAILSVLAWLRASGDSNDHSTWLPLALTAAAMLIAATVGLELRSVMARRPEDDPEVLFAVQIVARESPMLAQQLARMKATDTVLTHAQAHAIVAANRRVIDAAIAADAARGR